MIHIRLAFLLLLAAAGIYGCGGATKSTSRALSKQQLIREADTICYGITAKRASTTFSSVKDYAQLIPALASYEKAAVSELEKLTPPASMAARWKQIIASATVMSEITNKAGEIAEKDPRGLEKTQSLNAKLGEAENQMIAAAKQGGFKDCAQW